MGGMCGCLAGAEKMAGKSTEKPVSAPKEEKKTLLETPSAPRAAEAKQDIKVPAAVKEIVKEEIKVEQPYVAPTPVPVEVSEPTPASAPAPQVEPSSQLSEAAPQETQAAPSQAQPLGVGSCIEVYSNSFQAWCPGVVYALDESDIFLAYQVPAESTETDTSISTKTLAIDSEEIRTPVDSTGNESCAWLTASVEVYSHSYNAWCVGKITEITEGVLSVVFFYPGEPPDADPVMKQLPFGDPDFRLRGISGIEIGFQQPGAAGLGHDTLEVNSAVEVFSNSLNVWCPGIVEELKDGFATVAFFYPDMDPKSDEPAVKELPLGHQDLRVLGFGTAAELNTGPPVTEADLAIDKQIEVFSQSRQVWIVSTVKEIANGEVVVQLRYPDMPPDSELYEKVLPIGHPEMRLIGAEPTA